MAICGVVLLAGCGGSSSESTIRVSDSVPRLRSLLRANGVGVDPSGGTKPASLASAWTAFKQFAALAVSQKDLDDDPMADALLFDAGTYD